MSFETVVQTVIYDALSASTAVTDLVTGIYDAVPQQEAFPYITLGEALHSEWDTYAEVGNNVSIVINTWSRERGRQETKQIQGEIYNTLHRATLTVSGYNIAGIDFEQSESFMDADGLTRHGVQSFRILIERV